jgi:hypothetical protein
MAPGGWFVVAGEARQERQRQASPSLPSARGGRRVRGWVGLGGGWNFWRGWAVGGGSRWGGVGGEWQWVWGAVVCVAC